MLLSLAEKISDRLTMMSQGSGCAVFRGTGPRGFKTFSIKGGRKARRNGFDSPIRFPLGVGTPKCKHLELFFSQRPDRFAILVANSTTEYCSTQRGFLQGMPFSRPSRGYGLALRKSFTIGTMIFARCINVTWVVSGNIANREAVRGPMSPWVSPPLRRNISLT